MFLARHRIRMMSGMAQASDDQDGAGGSYEEARNYL